MFIRECTTGPNRGDLVRMRDKEKFYMLLERERERNAIMLFLNVFAWDSNILHQNLIPLTFIHRSTYV